MADRAISDDDSPESIVDLFDSDRWQARLEEARARREIALREKGKDPDSEAKRKLMPWEQDEATAPPSGKIEPIIQAPDSDRVDFADRVEVMRENVTKEEQAEPPSDTPKTPDVTPLPTSFDDLLTYDAYEDDEVDWAPPPKKPHSAINDDAPDVIELASRYASTLSAVPPAEEPEAETVKAAAPITIRTHPPALLIVGIVILAALPFTETVPPLDKGPDMPAIPTLRLQPALGFTTAMLWRPADTSSADWAPAATWSLPLSTVYSPPIPQFQTLPDTFMVPPGLGQISPDFSEPSVTAAAKRSVRPAALSSTFIDRVPGAFSRRPEPRPTAGDPVATTRAPSRPPEVASGNDTSPRVAPVSDADASSLGGVTALEAVSFDRAPDPDSAIPALNTPASVLQLTILVPQQQDMQSARDYADDAASRGHEVVALKDVNVSISARNLRYFHEADRAEAERLAEAYGAEARDFTWFAPKPDRGTAELWLEGRSAPPPPKRAAPVAAAPPEPERVAPAPKIVVVRKSEGLLSRLFGGHKVGATTSAVPNGTHGITSVTAPTPTSGGSDSGTDTSGGTDTGSDTGTGTGTGTDTGAGTDTGTSTGTGSDTSGTDTSDGSDTSSSGDTSSGGGGSSSGDDDSGSSSDGGSSGSSGSSNDGGSSSGGGSSASSGGGSGATSE